MNNIIRERRFRELEELDKNKKISFHYSYTPAGDTNLVYDDKSNILLSKSMLDDKICYHMATAVLGGYTEIKVDMRIHFSVEAGWEFDLSNIEKIKSESPEIYEYIIKLPGLAEEIEQAQKLGVTYWRGENKKKALEPILKEQQENLTREVKKIIETDKESLFEEIKELDNDVKIPSPDSFTRRGSTNLIYDKKNNALLAKELSDEKIGYSVRTPITQYLNEIKLSEHLGYSKENGWEFNVGRIDRIMRESPEIYEYLMKLPGFAAELSVARQLVGDVYWGGNEKKAILRQFGISKKEQQKEAEDKLASMLGMTQEELQKQPPKVENPEEKLASMLGMTQEELQKQPTKEESPEEKLASMLGMTKEKMADSMIAGMEQGIIDVNGNPINNSQQVYSGRKLGYAKIWILGLITAIISIGIIILGMILTK